MIHRLPRYRSPELGVHRDALKRLVSDFINQAVDNPDYNTQNVVHDCVVYIMQHKPQGLARVDGPSVQPMIQEIVAEMIKRRSTAPAAPQSWLKRAFGAVVAAARQLVH